MTDSEKQPSCDDSFITGSDVALLTGAKPQTVASWRTPARSQPLAFLKVGRRCLYRKSEVIAFIESGRRQPCKKA